MIAIAVKHMLAAGMEPEAIVSAVAEMEQQRPRTSQALRQERYRERHKASQSVTRDGCDAPPPSKEVPPAPLQETQPLPPPSPPKGGSIPQRFSEFWLAYPRKVGKRTAQLAYRRACIRADEEPEQQILAGLHRAKCAVRWREAPEFIPHPTTWLNRDGWLDELEPTPPEPEEPEVIRRIREDHEAWLAAGLEPAEEPENGSKYPILERPGATARGYG